MIDYMPPSTKFTGDGGICGHSPPPKAGGFWFVKEAGRANQTNGAESPWKLEDIFGPVSFVCK